VREQVLDVERAVGVADEVDRLVAVVAVGVLDQRLAPIEEVAHVRGEARVVSRHADVAVADVPCAFERLVHGLVEGRALGPPVVLDLDVDTMLIAKP
jgi:hypothetical protein